MRIVVALVIGYLLGSVLPADLLARARGVDIRAVGTRNPGATNALQQLGFWPGMLTGAYDASVGLISMGIAYWLGLAEGWVYLAGLSAVVGHVFPLFFGFRGGQGMAATVGMLIWCIATGLSAGLFSAAAIALLGVVAVTVYALTRSASMVGVFAVPVLAVEIVASRPSWQFGAFMVTLSAWIWLVQLGIVRERHLWRFVAWRHRRA